MHSHHQIELKTGIEENTLDIVEGVGRIVYYVPLLIMSGVHELLFHISVHQIKLVLIYESC